MIYPRLDIHPVVITNINGESFQINGRKLTLIMGPCVLESREHGLYMAQALKELTSSFNVNFIFKTSFQKANRTSLHSFTGMEYLLALSVFEEIRHTVNVPLLTDVHESHHVESVADHVDVLQIPAFLCRQTDLLLAAGETGKPVHIKKGQFLSPQEMRYAIQKITSTGNKNVMPCERGVSFGYNTLVVDFRSLVYMREFGYPVSFDVTHSTQEPGKGEQSGGNRRMAPHLARCAVATGVDVLFMEVHDQPEKALSDAACQLHLNDVSSLLEELLSIRQSLTSIIP